MKVVTRTKLKTSVTARIAGEDIACGDFVTVLHEIVEVPSFFWNNSAVSLVPDELVRIRNTPSDAGQPYKVIGVCLPFVYVKSHSGLVVVLNTRRQQLVRLNRNCARAVWKNLKSPLNKESK